MPEDRELKTGQAAAFEVLRAYLEARATFSAQDLELVRGAFVWKPLPAGEFLQRAGDVARYGAFVAKGCLRKYVIDSHGKEHIVQFAPETWWVGDTTPLAGPAPATYFIDGIEDSELLLIDGSSHRKLVEQVAAYGDGFRTGVQRSAAAKEKRIVSTLSESAEE